LLQYVIWQNPLQRHLETTKSFDFTAKVGFGF